MGDCQLFEGNLGLPAGSQLFGVLIDIALYGILTAQTYLYYLSFPRDGSFLKLLVALAYLLGGNQTALALVDLYNSSIGDQSCPAEGIFSTGYDWHYWFTIPISSSLVAMTVQCLYAYKLYILVHNIWISAFITSLSLAQFVSGIIGSRCLVHGGEVCQNGFDLLWGPLNIACDVTISVCMVTYLLRKRKQTIVKQTYFQVTQILQVILQTGMTTVIVALCFTLMLNLPLTFESIQLYFIPGLAMGKIYSNSMLALLNNRIIIEHGRNTWIGTWETQELSSLSMPSTAPTSPRNEGYELQNLHSSKIN